MGSAPLSFLHVIPYYRRAIESLYAAEATLAEQSYQTQLLKLTRLGFAAVHLIAPYMPKSSYKSGFVISNAQAIQQRWLHENGIAPYQSNDWETAIVREQIERLKPDVLYFSDPLSFNAGFLRTLKHRPQLTMAWRAADVPPGTDWHGYDLILSSLSGVRELAPQLGAKHSENFWPGFPRWIYEELQNEPAIYDAVFCGQWTTGQHLRRNETLLHLSQHAAKNPQMFSLAYYLNCEAGNLPPEVASFDHGPRFGFEMQRAIRRGAIGIDARAQHSFQGQDIGRNDTANMRLFEVAGMGRLLLTEARANLKELFTVGEEIETYQSTAELIEKIAFYTKNAASRERIARQGLERCLRDHSMERRGDELDRIIRRTLGIKNQSHHTQLATDSPSATAAGAASGANTQGVRLDMDTAYSDLASSVELLKAGKFQEVLSSLSPHLTSGVQQRELYHVAAIASLKLDYTAQGITYLKKEVECFPDNSVARNLLQMIIDQTSGVGSQASRAPAPQPTTQTTLAPTADPRSNVVVAKLQSALEALTRDDGPGALRLAEEALQQGITIPEMFWIHARCLNVVGRHEEAIKSLEKELSINPQHKQARAEFERLSVALGRKIPPPLNPEQRDYHTKLPSDVLKSIQAAGHCYQYRGIPMIKNPFDLGLYPVLLWKAKPRTIIEIGSKNGGSAVWFGDMLQNFGIDGHVYSVDIVKVSDVTHPKVTFLQGDGRNLGGTLTPQFLANLPRPWLIVEDADHSYETSRAVLSFFHPLLKSEEYIVIEDGIISSLSGDKEANSGPHKALKEFFAAVPGQYDIDATLSDFYGYNFTWCTNGFLRKKKYPINSSLPKELVRDFNTDDPAPQGIESQMSQNERFQLYAVAQALRNMNFSKGRFIEIGSYSGASLKLITRAFERLGRPFDGISVEPNGSEQFYQVLSELTGKVRHLKMFSNDAASIINQEIARDGVKPQLIFVDGDHSYRGVKDDAERYFPMLAPGGYIVFHDFLPELNDENRGAIHFHHAGTVPGIRQACLEVMEGANRCPPVDVPLLYPDDYTQTQPHLPVIPGVRSTLRVYQKPLA